MSLRTLVRHQEVAPAELNRFGRRRCAATNWSTKTRCRLIVPRASRSAPNDTGWPAGQRRDAGSHLLQAGVVAQELVVVKIFVSHPDLCIVRARKKESMELRVYKNRATLVTKSALRCEASRKCIFRTSSIVVYRSWT